MMKYLLFIAIFDCAAVAYSQPHPEGKGNATVHSTQTSSERAIDSLTHALPTANPRQQFDIQFELFGWYVGVDPVKASTFLEDCIALSSRSGDSLLIAKTAHARGYVLKNKGDLRGAIELYEYALGIARRNRFDDQIKFLLNSLAIAYTSNASFDKALKYNLESLKIREMKGDPLDISIVLNNIALVYVGLEDLDRALAYYNRCYALKISNGIQYDLNLVLSNTGDVLNDLGQYCEAELKLREAFYYCDRNECRIADVANSNLIMGTSLAFQKRNSEAELYLREAIRLSKQVSSSEILVGSYYRLAQLKYIQGEHDKALRLLDSGQWIATNSDYQKWRASNSLLYSEIYEAEGRYKMALYHHKQYSDFSGDILNGELAGRIATFEADYKQIENTSKINAQAEVLRLQERAIKQHFLVSFLIGAVALLMIVIAWVLLRSNRQKQQINSGLENRVRERTSELQRNRDQLKHAHDEQGLVLNKISSDLVSALATAKGLSNNASRDLPYEQAVYFKEAEASAERLVNYIHHYSSIVSINGFKQNGTTMPE